VPTGGEPNQLVIGDLNGDGKPDLVIADASATGNAIVLFQDRLTRGSSSRRRSSRPATAPRRSDRDLNGDGAPDIVAATSDASGNNGAGLHLLPERHQSGTFPAPVTVPAGTAPGGQDRGL